MIEMKSTVVFKRQLAAALQDAVDVLQAEEREQYEGIIHIRKETEAELVIRALLKSADKQAGHE